MMASRMVECSAVSIHLLDRFRSYEYLQQIHNLLLPSRKFDWSSTFAVDDVGVPPIVPANIPTPLF